MPPIITPSIMKMRRIARSLAPSAFMIAISLLFSVTIKSSVQMMQKLATRIASERMMKVAIFSSLRR